MNKLLTHTCLLLFSTALFAQTSNQGVLYVAEGTQFSTVEAMDNLEDGQFLNDGETFLYSHLNNDGIIDFYQETGITRFIGSEDQVISGAQTSYLYDAHFFNRSAPAPFLLTGAINVFGMADFEEGIVDNRNFGGSFAFGNNAFHHNTSDYSHVDGTVDKLGATDFIYPIGHKNYYRFAGISAPATEGSVFKGTYFFENSDELHSHELKAGIITAINDQEYWTIERESDDDVLITLSWREETTPRFIINAAEDDKVIITRWDEATNMWVDEGGVANVNEQTVTTVVSGYGLFTLAKVGKKDPGNVTVYTGVTPNDDGINDYFFIDIPNDGSVRDLKVKIFNRWGVQVYESDDYGVNRDVFRGYSSGRATINKNEQLPSGTYFYVLDYEYGDPDDPTDINRHKQAGYLYLSGN